jgi:hypothetical protein
LLPIALARWADGHPKPPPLPYGERFTPAYRGVIFATTAQPPSYADSRSSWQSNLPTMDGFWLLRYQSPDEKLAYARSRSKPYDEYYVEVFET